MNYQTDMEAHIFRVHLGLSTQCAPKCKNSPTTVVLDFTQTWPLSCQDNILWNH